MADITFKGVRRRKEGDKVEALVPGGWMKLSFLKPDQLKRLEAMPEVNSVYSRNANMWTEAAFEAVWEPDEMEDDPPMDPPMNPPENDGSFNGETPDTDGEVPTDGEPQGEPKGDGRKPSESRDDVPTFQMPSDGDGDGEGGSQGDDNLYLTFAEKDDKGRILKTTAQLVSFKDEFDPRAQALGQAVMDQTIGFVRGDIAIAMDTLKADIEPQFVGLASDIKTLDEGLNKVATQSAANTIQLGALEDKLKNFKPENDGNVRQVLVSIDLTRPDHEKVKIDGLSHMALPQLLKLVAAGIHTYLPGVPGGGKSHTAEQVARALGWKYGSLSLGPTTPESRLMGGMDANGHFHLTALIECIDHAEANPDSGAIYVMDEMDNGHPGVIATLNSLLANGWITLPDGRTRKVGRNFVVIACANTFGTGPTAEFSGRNRLDAATLDRFAYLPWETDLGLEQALVEAHLGPLGDEGWLLAKDWLKVWRQARANVAEHGLKVFVTMRGAINGAILLHDGWTIRDAYAMILGNKLPTDQARKVNPL